MSREKDLYELGAELNAVSVAMCGISYGFDDENCDRLDPRGMVEALFGLSWHIDRIVEDLNEMELRQVAEGKAVAKDE